MKYLLFGTGDYYERYKKWFENDEIVALLDNSSVKQNTYIDGIKVVSPETGVQLKYDIVVILSFYVKSMKAQLVELGVDEKCIYHFFDLHKLFGGNVNHKPVKYYGNAEKLLQMKNDCGTRILLLSHDLTLGGPALALFHAAEILRNKRYEVIFASMLDGPLRQQILDAEMPVIVDENLQIETMNEATWISRFNLIICNTISYYVFLSDRNTEVPIIWWLHDSQFFYDGVDKDILRNIDRTNLDVVSVGPVPRNALQTYAPEVRVGDLLYGVTDLDFKEPSFDVRMRNEKIRFMTIGYIENRKGQDILIQAIRRLPDELLQKCEFYLVGQNTSMLAQQIQIEIQSMPQIIMTGTVDRNEINELLSMTDALICPSREDPMPTVAAEAMMHSVPCILSDVTGTAAYIKNGFNGIIFQSENATELAEKIQWCVTHRDELALMGIHAREIYEKVFSMKAFESNLLKIVMKKLK